MKTSLKNRQILAKIVHFQSNTRAKARSCRIFQCSSLLELKFSFSSMLKPARCSIFSYSMQHYWQPCFYLLVEFPSGCNRRTLTELCVGKSIFIVGINPFSRWILRSTSISYNHFTIIFMARFAFFTIQ